jgi:hypothetical protein
VDWVSELDDLHGEALVAWITEAHELIARSEESSKHFPWSK